jgi:LPS-assembly protein
MLRRLFLVFLPSFTASTSFANEASWNCEQNKDTKEWVCVGDAKPKALPKEVSTQVEPSKSIQPVIAEPAQIKQPVQITKPTIPAVIEKIQPVVPKPAPMPPAVVAKPTEIIKPSSPELVQTNIPANTEALKSTQPTIPELPKPIDDGTVTQPGWNCGAQKGDEAWNCQLVGADPKGKAATVETNESTMRILNPAFDHQQEQIFGTLTSQLPYDPWGKCDAEPSSTPQAFIPGADKREISPMDVKSDYAEVFESEVGSYSGNVKMSRADQKSTSKTANYNSLSDVLDLHGDVYYSEDELALHSNTASLNLASDQAKLRDVQFIAASTPLRGRAKTVYRESKTLSHYQEVAYTSCRPGNQDWVVHTSELKMDKTSGKGTAKNAWLEFKGAPVLYSPYLSFPIDNRRLSGFMAPSFGSTKYSGFRLAAPYYWNIAPNYDATLIPRELSKRGPLLASKFRYLTEQSKGRLGLEFMPNDSQTNTSRYLGSLKTTSSITNSITANTDLNYVSDKTYFAELGNALSFSNFNYLKSSADINYAREGVNLSGQFVNYQSINTTTNTLTSPLPYRKLPQINLNLDHAFNFMPLNTAMENEYVYFQGAYNTDAKGNRTYLANGQRFNTKPSISVPLQTASSFVIPKLSLQHTNYALNNLEEGAPNSQSRTLPIFSADSGLNFERGLNIGNTEYLHTLEPRLFYLYVPYTNQQNIPVFDTALYDFNYDAMFRENSFSGTDRVQEANQITTAITSRLIDDKTGLERLKLNFGEIFYFSDRNVTLGYNYKNLGYNYVQGSYKQSNSYSNLVTELSSQLTQEFSITSGLQWNPQQYTVQRTNTGLLPVNVNTGLQRINAGLHYANKANEILNIGYTYRNNPLIDCGKLNVASCSNITQTDASFRYPVYDNWNLMSRWQYSLLYKTTQDAFFGIEKENCCWRFRIALRHYINNISNGNSLTYNQTTINNPTGTAQNGIFFEIELKGMSAIGDDMDTFLQKEIYGYQGNQND